jgi:hypothetical protein
MTSEFKTTMPAELPWLRIVKSTAHGYFYFSKKETEYIQQRIDAQLLVWLPQAGSRIDNASRKLEAKHTPISCL